MSRITVVGAGSWGTALAAVLADNGHEVTLWALEPEVAAEVNADSTNQGYLPDAPLPASLRANSDLPAALDGAEIAVSVVPSQFVRSTWAPVMGGLDPEVPIVSASKGIELSTLLRMDQVISELRPNAGPDRFAVLSGPSFAAEVVRRAPTLVVAASESRALAGRVQELFQNRYFRVYTSPDVVGVELGGSLKNVVAIAAGAAAGLGFGHNTRAALITRGLAEMRRLGLAMGARAETFSGLAGMGDLVLTCTGELSRNRTVGFRIGQGESLDDVLGEGRSVAEGVKTVQSVRELAGREGVEMPIVEEVHAMLVEGRPPREALDRLMAREPTAEMEW